MIRPCTSDDKEAVMTVAEDSGLFPVEELSFLEGVFSHHVNDKNNADHCWLIEEQGGAAVSAAYYGPEVMADRVWNLFMLLVKSDQQGKGLGEKMVRHIEQTLQERGGRMLLVETSSLPKFERSQAFYRKCGFSEEARIRNFYKYGEDKVVFLKTL